MLVEQLYTIPLSVAGNLPRMELEGLEVLAEVRHGCDFRQAEVVCGQSRCLGEQEAGIESLEAIERGRQRGGWRG